jgi:hypothetical protein
MVKSTTAATTDVAAIATEDGHAVIGGRPATPEFTEQRQRQASGLPPAGAAAGQSVAEPVAGLPNIHVARQVAGRVIQQLRARADGIERDLARGVIGATGQPLPYLAQQHAEARAELPRVREEIERFESMTDLEVRQWAFEQGVR